MKFTNRIFALTTLVFSLILLISGCASMTTTVGFDREENEYYSDVAVEAGIATKTDAELVANDGQTKAVEVVESRETYLSSNGYWQAAIGYLQIGNEDDARWALQQSLALNSKSKVANELLYQLDVDAVNELGGEYYVYKVQHGDSLSKLSKLYLDDALKFYLLAKYNNISDPSRLVVGQVIHIPGVKKISETEKHVDNVVSAEDSSIESFDSELLKDAREMLSAGENISTIELVENSGFDLSVNSEVVSILVKAYYLEANKLNANHDFIESKLLLARAIELEPDNTDVNMMLIDMNEIDHATVLYNKSLKALASNNLVKAYELINQVLDTQPGYKQALIKRPAIKKSLSEYYYKQALMAQRKQQLSEAIEFWDKVLALDEGNDDAKLYRAKVISLKIKLDRFVSN